MALTPQEKAKELVDKFKTYADWNGFDLKRGLINAKQCALIAVDEILDIIEDDGFTFAEYHDKKTIEYWFEVKQEIERTHLKD
jgi:hypothetical protein